jgi:hypothetical protein
MAANRLPRMNDAVLRTACLMALAVCVPGCGSGRPVMDGRVTLDGEPIEKGWILLVPANGKGQTAGVGIVDGHYRMEASPGPMKVIINATRKTDRKQHIPTPEDTGAMADVYVSSVPPRYNEATELVVTIGPGRNECDFALESDAPPRSK